MDPFDDPSGPFYSRRRALHVPLHILEKDSISSPLSPCSPKWRSINNVLSSDEASGTSVNRKMAENSPGVTIRSYRRPKKSGSRRRSIAIMQSTANDVQENNTVDTTVLGADDVAKSNLLHLECAGQEDFLTCVTPLSLPFSDPKSQKSAKCGASATPCDSPTHKHPSKELIFSPDVLEGMNEFTRLLPSPISTVDYNSCIEVKPLTDSIDQQVTSLTASFSKCAKLKPDNGQPRSMSEEMPACSGLMERPPGNLEHIQETAAEELKSECSTKIPLNVTLSQFDSPKDELVTVDEQLRADNDIDGQWPRVTVESLVLPGDEQRESSSAVSSKKKGSRKRKYVDRLDPSNVLTEESDVPEMFAPPLGARRSQRIRRKSIELFHISQMVLEVEDIKVNSEKFENLHKELEEASTSAVMEVEAATKPTEEKIENKTTKPKRVRRVSMNKQEIVASRTTRAAKQKQAQNIEDIYHNKLWRTQMPKEKSWEIIYENSKKSSTSKRSKCSLNFDNFYSKVRLKRRRQKAVKRGWKPLTKKRSQALDVLLTERVEQWEEEVSEEDNQQRREAFFSSLAAGQSEKASVDIQWVESAQQGSPVRPTQDPEESSSSLSPAY